MAFIPKDWRDGPVDTSTPLSAAAMEDMEARLSIYTDSRSGPGRPVSGGKSIIGTEDSRTNSAYGLMTNADRVQSVVLPTDGLLVIAYKALWKAPVSVAAMAGLFLGANQIKFPSGTGFLNAECQSTVDATPNYNYLTSSMGAGLDTTANTAGDSPLDATTGQMITTFGHSGNDAGGPVYVYAAAGTYDVTVQFKSASGAVFVKERKLWVWAMDFSA